MVCDTEKIDMSVKKNKKKKKQLCALKADLKNFPQPAHKDFLSNLHTLLLNKNKFMLE